GFEVGSHRVQRRGRAGGLRVRIHDGRFDRWQCGWRAQSGNRTGDRTGTDPETVQPRHGDQTLVSVWASWSVAMTSTSASNAASAPWPSAERTTVSAPRTSRPRTIRMLLA